MKNSKELQMVQHHCATVALKLEWYNSAMIEKETMPIDTDLLYYTVQLMYAELNQDKPSLSLIKEIIQKEVVEREKLEPVYAEIVQIAKNYAKKNGLIDDIFSPN